MANRSAFIVKKDSFCEETFDFKFYCGFAISQCRKSIDSFHEAIHSKYPNSNILEISSKSKDVLGNELSAFNLTLNVDDKTYTVEKVYQASKVFELGGPYLDLLDASPKDAKRDERLRNSGKIISFRFMNKDYSNKPITAFYDYLYCKALNQHKDLVDEIIKYDCFTDIVFGNKSINCQARSASIFVYLYRNNLIDKALENHEKFIEYVYKNN